jgi:WD40 repeat protein
MSRYLLLFMMFLLPFAVYAQGNPDFPLPPLEPITHENADQLVQVGRLGNGVVRGIAWSPDGSTLAIATSIGVWIHDADNPDDPPVLLEMEAGASSVAASDDLIAAGSDDGTVHVWDIATLERQAIFEGHLYAVGTVVFNAEGSQLASGDTSGVVRFWNIETLTEFTTLESLGAPYSMGDQLLFSSTGNFARVGYCDSVELITFELSTTRREIEGFMCPSQALTFEDNGDSIVALSNLGIAYTWNLETQDMGRSSINGTLSEDADEVTSPDGTLIATGGNDAIVRLLDAETGAELALLRGHIRAVEGVAFSPDGRLLASGSLDRTLQVWDVEAALATPDTPALATLEGQTSGVTSVAFNGDGTLLASAGYDGTIRLWGVPAE